MSETMIARQGISVSSKETVSRYVAQTLSHITRLEPRLSLLQEPDVDPVAYESLFTHCYDAGSHVAQQSLPLTAEVIPDELKQSPPVWVQGIGLLCLAAGYMSVSETAITHNRLCDCVKRISTDLPQLNEEVTSGFSKVRGVALPVFRRLRRDGYAPHVMLLQTLLHLVAWRSGSQYARQQAQRLLWLGGVLGDGGELNLMVLDKELHEQSMEEEHLSALLIFTDFLAHFPAGPIFND